MKYCMIIPDGMADFPLKELDGKTCIEAALIPNIDHIAQNGQLGTVQTVPDGFSPGSDVAAMSLLGYDPKLYYTGRAPIEAASIGIDLGKDLIAFRCNLVTINNDTLEDYSAGHISNNEANVLIDCLNDKLGSDLISFHPGNSYRHITTYRTTEDLEAICKPPHDIMGQKFKPNFPKGNGDELLIKLMNDSYQILSNHNINKERVNSRKNPANMIWLWGQGRKPSVPSFYKMFNINSAVISAVDLVNGLAYIMGMDIIKVPGATGNIDTDYDAKAKYAIDALENHDFVIVHIEAPDEMGHSGNVAEKIKAIENIDKKIVSPILKCLENKKDFRIIVLPDHYTPITKRTHTSEPVPFAMLGYNIEKGEGFRFSETNGNKSKLHFAFGYKLIDYFFKYRNNAANTI